MRPRIRAATLSGYAGLAASLGIDPDRLATSVGLVPAQLDGSDRWIPAGPAARLLELSAQESGCTDFGLRMAELRHLGTLGPLSVVLRDEPTLRAALELLIRYRHSYNEALNMRMHVDGELTTVTVWLEFGEQVPLHQASDLVMGALVGIVRALVGADWVPLSASFAHDEPADPGAYHRLFGPGVRFAEEFTGLVFRAGQLETATITSDPSLRPYTHEFLRRVSVGPETATAQATEIVELLLPFGRCSVQQVSRHLGLRPRELQGRLTVEGSTFSAVVNAARRGLAERNLPNSRLPLTEISQLLGFAAPSAFSRWFSQNFGTTPSAWRSAARAEPAGAPSRPAPRAAVGRSSSRGDAAGGPDAERSAQAERSAAGR
jgi:AraC-like DNA-binding protein